MTRTDAQAAREASEQYSPFPLGKALADALAMLERAMALLSGNLDAGCLEKPDGSFITRADLLREWGSAPQ